MEKLELLALQVVHILVLQVYLGEHDILDLQELLELQVLHTQEQLVVEQVKQDGLVALELLEILALNQLQVCLDLLD